MKIPHFQLEKVYSDGSSEAPELHELHGLDLNCRMGRRGFLLTSALGAGAAALLAGCGPAAGGLKPSSVPAIDFSKSGLEPRFHAIGVAAHLGGIVDLAFSPNGKLLASASVKPGFKLWSMPSGKLLHTFTEKKIINSFVFSADGKRLYAGLDDGLAYWDAPFTRSPEYIEKTSKPINSLSLAPDGKMLANTQNGVVQVRSFPGGKVINEFGITFQRVIFTPDSAALVACGTFTDTVLYSLAGEKLRQFPANTKETAPSPDGKILALRIQTTLRILNLGSGKMLSALKVSTSSNYVPLKFSRDGKWLASGMRSVTWDGAVLLRPPFTSAGAFLTVPSGQATALAFSADGIFLACGASDGGIYIWEIPQDGSDPKSHATLFDPAAVDKKVSVMSGTTREGSTWVGKCGDPMPAGAVCTCNCVPGAYSAPVPTCTCNTVPTGGGYYCTCNQICTCVPIK